jgi:hypothetical protein
MPQGEFVVFVHLLLGPLLFVFVGIKTLLSLFNPAIQPFQYS